MGKMNFQNLESLQPVVEVVNEAAIALNDVSRTIRNSAMPEVLAGALGGGLGAAGSFAALYALGSVAGLSAAGIASGLAAAGAVVGGGMAAGIFVLAAPVAIFAGAGVGIAAFAKNEQLKKEKYRLYKAVLERQNGIISALKMETNTNKERIDYLQSLNILLTRAVQDLEADLGI